MDKNTCGNCRWWDNGDGALVFKNVVWGKCRSVAAVDAEPEIALLISGLFRHESFTKLHRSDPNPCPHHEPKKEDS